jgi:hypothetical protein
MNSPSDDLLRVVVVRRGKVRPAEYRLREGEAGLSLFRGLESPGPDAIVAAVRAAGKQGELGITEIPVSVLQELGLRLVSTPGGTPDPEVNAAHVEARIGRLLRIRLWFRRVSVVAYFNDHLAPRIAAAARLVE